MKATPDHSYPSKQADGPIYLNHFTPILLLLALSLVKKSKLSASSRSQTDFPPNALVLFTLTVVENLIPHLWQLRLI